MSNENKPPTGMSRRHFMGTAAAAAGLTIVPRHVLGAGYQAPSDTVNVAVVGYAHGMGSNNLKNAMKSDNIIALCDVDESAAAKQARVRQGTTPDKFPKPPAEYKDFRVMLEKQKDIDAVIVATPDHMHAIVAMTAMQLGKHVYVQKPLTRTVAEARALTAAARKYKVVTQMGNQGHSEEGLRLMQEWFNAGAIGEVREVHCWTNRPIWPQGMPRPTEEMPVPEGMDWDLWLGGAPPRPFHKTYHPSFWRAWQDFGAGAMGDMACHVMDASYTVLKLGSPTSVIATAGAIVQAPPAGQGGWGVRVKYNDSYPPSSIIHLSYPQRGDLPPVKMHWYDGGLLPERPDELEPDRKLPESGTIFVGSKGKMWCETYSESPRLIPESFMASFTNRPPKTLPRVPGGREGHEKNWLDAIRSHGQAVSHFDYAGPFTESVLLGNLALRFSGQRLDWDAPNMKVTNVADANQFVGPTYRSGWTLPG
jgi:predicted dehydrogenase